VHMPYRTGHVVTCKWPYRTGRVVTCKWPYRTGRVVTCKWPYRTGHMVTCKWPYRTGHVVTCKCCYAEHTSPRAMKSVQHHNGDPTPADSPVAAIDCQMSEWTKWTQCSATCGDAQRTRRRYVIREPENGGKECPERREMHRPCKTRPCSGKHTNTNINGCTLSVCLYILIGDKAF
jgi:hypothetical protein